MNSYLALIQINLKLALRERAVLFFNYVFPLIFFFAFGIGFGGGAQGSGMTQIVSMVLVIGLLGSGLFGAGMRAVAEREANILRRYKVAPITAAPILVSSMITGWILYIPSVVMMIALAHLKYKMPLPERMGSLLILITVGAFAMRALGLIIASVVNSVAESNILIQFFYMPMLFLSGATFPLTMLPTWAQTLAQFLPASHLFSAMQGVMLRKESVFQNLTAIGAMLLAMVVATFISIKLFRWEKDEKIQGRAKLWLVAVFIPFLALGGYQTYSKENIAKSKMYERDLRRSRTRLITGARVFIGDGRVIDQAGVLLKDGKIAKIYEGVNIPEAKAVDADAVEAFGKTLLPGFIDVHVHLGAPGGIPEDQKNYDAKKQMERNLAAYLYSGVTAVRSVGDFVDPVLDARARVQSGEKLGAGLYACGPLFTAEGGHGTEYFKQAPEFLRTMAGEQFTRIPKSEADAGEQVNALKARNVDCVKAVLEGGVSGYLFNRMDIALYRAVISKARRDGLPSTTHTGNAQDIADAISAGSNGIEHGSARERIPDEIFARMAKAGIAYDPTLSVMEAMNAWAAGNTNILERSLLAQAVPNKLLLNTKKMINSPESMKSRTELSKFPDRVETAQDNLLRAWKAGVMLVTGSDAGNLLVFHGPTVQHELQLWVKAGIPAQAALQAATYNGARALRKQREFGLIKEGYDATLLIVDGNPLQDIDATERISAVFLKGERVDRSSLFE